MRQLNILIIALLLLPLASCANDFDKEAYYAKAVGLKGQALKTALAGIIASHTTISYDGLYEAYKKTDLRPDGTIWDMYSNVTQFDPDRDRAGSYKKEGDCFNREHSVPQSIFNEASPMKTDLYNVFPTDGYVNNRRSNYCFAEVGTIKFQSSGGFSKQGSPSARMAQLGCYETSVFEPNDIYKGDMARSCFYFVTCYESRMKGFKTFGMFQTNAYPALTEWARDMLLEWSEKDPVSTKETDRIEEAYLLQRNRNPFIDFPGLEQYIWGTHRNVPFSVKNYVNPYDKESGGSGNSGDSGGSGNSGDTGNTGDTGDTGDSGGSGAMSGTPLYYERVTTTPSDWSGEYLIVYEQSEESGYALDGCLKEYDAAGNYVQLAITDGRIALSQRADDAVFTIAPVSGQAGSYSLCGSSGMYLGAISSSNSLASSSDPIAVVLTSDDKEATITSNLSGSTKMVLRYNVSANRFRFYKSGQNAVVLYRKVYQPGSTSVEGMKEGRGGDRSVSYDLKGRRVGPSSRGIYVKNGKKVMKFN